MADIIEAAGAIDSHLSALTEEKAPESIVIDAVKYNLVAIGEAAGRLSGELVSVHPEVEWGAVRGLRNVLTHEYFRVRTDLILQIATDSVPKLLASAQAILGEEDA